MAEAARRAADILGALCGLVLAAPVLAVCAALIRLTSPGPALFRQRRLGKDGRPFVLLKLRSMYPGAPPVQGPDGSSFAGADDPRVTPFGRFLRRTSLDELPQLWNVLRGDMSLVGPRPDEVRHMAFYTEAEKAKLRVKPGLTGLAQISGRNRISWARRKQLDIEYAGRRTLALDCWILARTIPYVLFGRDVHTASPIHREVKPLDDQGSC